MIGFGLNNGLQALIARRAGENRPEEIGKIFSQGIYIAFAIATISILLTWVLAPTILRQVIRSEGMAEKAINFLKIRIWGLIFLYIYQMRNALLVGTNQSKYLVFGTLAEAITNIIFDYGFIFGHLGFPELGLNGGPRFYYRRVYGHVCDLPCYLAKRDQQAVCSFQSLWLECSHC
jgi:Na+-driven multidrug efflux pump